MANVCFKESDYEKLRRENIEENERKLKELFPELNFNRSGKGLLTSSARKRSPVQSAEKKDKPYSTRQTRLSFPIRKNPSRGCRRKSDIGPGGISEFFTDFDLGSNPPPLIIKWPGKLTEGIEIKRRPSIEIDIPSRPRTYTRREFHDVREEDLALVAERTSEKQYDSINGTSCHQCRQKTDDLKTVCRSENCIGIRGQFCGPCLKNRYGEDAKAAIMNPEWHCPPCRGICNCSFCMKKRGRRATGILIHAARDCGFNDVKSFLGD